MTMWTVTKLYKDENDLQVYNFKSYKSAVRQFKSLIADWLIFDGVMYTDDVTVGGGVKPKAQISEWLTDNETWYLWGDERLKEVPSTEDEFEEVAFETNSVVFDVDDFMTFTITKAEVED